jgi:hypothetical protein
MVKLLLSLKAELENVTDLQPSSDDFKFFFKVLVVSIKEESYRSDQPFLLGFLFEGAMQQLS